MFSQDHTFDLISDHLVQRGPSFPHPTDIPIDASKNEVTIHAMEKGKEKDTTEFIELPEDISNGMILTLLKNIPPSAPETKVAMLATSSKPRLVKLARSSVRSRLAPPSFQSLAATRKPKSVPFCSKNPSLPGVCLNEFSALMGSGELKT